MRSGGLGEVFRPDARHLGGLHPLGHFVARVTGEDHQVVINHQRHEPAELLDRGHELRELALVMGTGVIRVDLERRRREQFDLRVLEQVGWLVLDDARTRQLNGASERQARCGRTGGFFRGLSHREISISIKEIPNGGFFRMPGIRF